MECTGACACGLVKVAVAAQENTENIHPRVCDCDYCKQYPSALISHPSMVIDVQYPLTDLKIERNGDGVAGFHRCPDCNSLIVVACTLDAVVRGAVNAHILKCDGAFGDSVDISPKSLKVHEKMERWGKLWGTVRESVA